MTAEERTLRSFCSRWTSLIPYMFQWLAMAKVLVCGMEALSSGRPHVPAIPGAAVNEFVESRYQAEYAGGLVSVRKLADGRCRPEQ